MITPRMNLIGYNIATAKECQRGSRPLPCTYVDVDRQGGNKLQTVTNSEGGPVPAMLPFARLPSAPRSSVQGLPLTCTNHLQHVMLNLVSVVLMRAAEKHSIQRPGTRRGGRTCQRSDSLTSPNDLLQFLTHSNKS